MWRWVLAFGVAWALACGGGSAPSEPAVVNPAHQPSVVGDFTVEVTGASKEHRVGNRIYSHTAPDGNTLLLVKVSLSFGGTEPASLLGRFHLRDDEERSFVPTGECQIGLGKEAFNGLQTLNPGQRAAGTVCFQVPSDATGLQFGFKEGMLSQPSWFALPAF